MIKSLVVKNEGNYDSEGVILEEFKLLNFIYGANGSGKTTLSKVIANEDDYPDCTVNWKAGNKLKTLVYNRDFVSQNFNPDTELKGVFTLGEGNADTVQKIKAAEKNKKSVIEKLIKKRQVIEGADGNTGKIAELEALETEFTDQCWTLKKKYENDFKTAFKGSIKKGEAFKERLIREAQNNTEELLTLAELQEQAQTIYAEDPVKENLINPISFTNLLALEQDPILTNNIIGRHDVDVAAMIKKLGNSDWVNQGRVFYDQNDGHCPFCQQEAPHSLSQSLNEYFDETYSNDMKSLQDLETSYSIFSTSIPARINEILKSDHRFLDKEKLRNHFSVFHTNLIANSQHIEKKTKEPSERIELNALKDITDKINTEIVAANEKAESHNKKIDNLTKEKRALTAKIWRFLVVDIQALYDTYRQRKNNFDSTISSIVDDIMQLEADMTKYSNEVRKLETEISSIQPTIDAINTLLSSYGFKNFSLAESEKKGFYKIIRPNGVDAQATLSEGEKTFITFLYFYHLLKGSDTESGTIEERVVVFDDPISSLDSDILFIVSSLVKNVFDEISLNTGQIKQAFVLTHNIYFHKEISFKRDSGSFWIIRKKDKHSVVEHHDTNPIKNSYELLWREIQRDDYSVLTILNTLRRILELYF